MTDREKLAFLLATSPSLDLVDGRSYEQAADDLIANGVTVQKWIPVTERLPKVGCKVRVIDRVTGEVTNARLNDSNCFVFKDGRGHGASHWMPLSEPTKEEW